MYNTFTNEWQLHDLQENASVESLDTQLHEDCGKIIVIFMRL